MGNALVAQDGGVLRQCNVIIEEIGTYVLEGVLHLGVRDQELVGAHVT